MGASFTGEAAAKASPAGTPRQAPRHGSAFEIFFRVSAYLAWLMAWRLALVARPAPARRFADLLQDLGASFVKLAST